MSDDNDSLGPMESPSTKYRNASESEDEGSIPVLLPKPSSSNLSASFKRATSNWERASAVVKPVVMFQLLMKSLPSRNIEKFDLKQSEENIVVAVRARPLNQREDSGCMVIDPVRKSVSVPASETDKETRNFFYDTVIDESVSQEQVFDLVMSNPMKKYLAGFNVCIFCYGQTGSGKTWTMLGREDSPQNIGIVPRVIRQIFDYDWRSQNIAPKMSVSILEIYNDRLKDLLVTSVGPGYKLEIREDKNTGVFVEGQRAVHVATPEEAAELLDSAMELRAVGQTNMNERSSRSHMVFTLTLEQQAINDPLGINKTSNKIHLVDLAGSERADATGATGDRLKEGSAINMSLSALGNVINALVKKDPYIPFRSSKLTRLLTNSLGGNSSTLMIANVSPALINLNETVSTLRFADRAKEVKNNAHVNLDLDPRAIALKELKEENDLLKKQIAKLKYMVDFERVKHKLSSMDNLQDLLTFTPHHELSDGTTQTEGGHEGVEDEDTLLPLVAIPPRASYSRRESSDNVMGTMSQEQKAQIFKLEAQLLERDEMIAKSDQNVAELNSKIVQFKEMERQTESYHQGQIRALEERFAADARRHIETQSLLLKEKQTLQEAIDELKKSSDGAYLDQLQQKIALMQKRETDLRAQCDPNAATLDEAIQALIASREKFSETMKEFGSKESHFKSDIGGLENELQFKERELLTVRHDCSMLRSKCEAQVKLLEENNIPLRPMHAITGSVEELEAAKSTISRLQLNIEKLTQEATKLRQEAEDGPSGIPELKSAIARLERQAAKKDKENESLTAKIAELEAALKEATLHPQEPASPRTSSTLMAAPESLRGSFTNLTAPSPPPNRSRGNSVAVNNVDAIRAKDIASLEEKDKEIKNLKSVVAKLRFQKEGVEVELNQMREKLENMSHTPSFAHVAVDALREEHHKALHAKDLQIENQDLRIDELKRLLKDKEMLLVQSEVINDEGAKSEISRLKGQVEQLVKDKENAVRAFVNLQRANEHKPPLDTPVLTMPPSLQASEGSPVSLHAINQALSEKEAAVSEAKALKNRINELEVQISELKGAQNTDLKSLLVSRERELGEKTYQISLLELEISALKQSVREKEQQIKTSPQKDNSLEIRLQLSDAQAALNTKEREVRILKQDLLAKEEGLRVAEDASRRKTQDLQAKDAALHAKEEELWARDSVLRGKDADLRAKDRELQTAADTSARLQAQINSLQSELDKMRFQPQLSTSFTSLTSSPGLNRSTDAEKQKRIQDLQEQTGRLNANRQLLGDAILGFRLKASQAEAALQKYDTKP